ncbi:hypothetical protein [Peredibacter starrii]|uniref:Uncharacterized protein n=1 Tax=Peredibacter starrii TaxID=28202 RepID=A0AAX4HIZ1_9BACT|nr:hypothetical protein [Peredibacter starrii]WPU63201.1 hypothetical protein SOO65_10945 [Peredibacter starrii]
MKKIILLILCVACNASQNTGTVKGHQTSMATTSTSEAWSTQGCNTTSYQQDTTDQTLFWGRRLIYSSLSGEDANNECTWQRWGVALYRADFAKKSLTFLKFAFMPMAKIGDGRTITTAYDPTVAIIGGVKYVAFECHGEGFSGSVGACVGRVDTENQVVASTVKVYVDGVSSTNPNLIPSASVPKLTSTTSGKAYLSWTQVNIDKSTGKWIKLLSRSIEFNPSMARINSDGAASNTYNPNTANGTADLFDVKEIRPGKFFFTGARGENGCKSPMDNIAGCYNLEIGVANAVTENGAFDGYSQTVYTLPDNPIEYFRWAYNPVMQTWGVFGAFINRPGTATARTLPGGLYFIPIDISLLPVKNAAICNPATQPSPHWGVKNGTCMRSCGQIGGSRAFTTTCASNGFRDVGVAYDVAYCCGPLCDSATQPAPHWGVKNNQCLRSCGQIGGTVAPKTACSKNGLKDMGFAYDVPFCCGPICDPKTRPAPNWGVKNGQCLASCGGIGGTRAFTTSCAQNGMKDAGVAYDVPYCCK